MNQTGPRFWDLFLEVYEALPRQGPGDRASAEKALRLCGELPPAPDALDLGCGVGAQTRYLAELTSGTILAVDNHAPFIERLNRWIVQAGLSGRVRAAVGDMGRLELPAESFDLVWSEGALYQIGLENALRVCFSLLRPGGCLVFTDAVWRKENPPAEARALFDLDYPAMGRPEDATAAITRAGFEPAGHFTLPDEAWRTDFYAPMEARIAELRGKYSGDAEASSALDLLAREPELHERYSGYYAYEFFAARKPAPQGG